MVRVAAIEFVVGKELKACYLLLQTCMLVAPPTETLQCDTPVLTLLSLAGLQQVPRTCFVLLACGWSIYLPEKMRLKINRL